MDTTEHSDKRTPEDFNLSIWLSYPRLESWYGPFGTTSELFREFGFDQAFTAFRDSLFSQMKN
ncbi:hypothetical protein Dehly_1482 [Dehalogenimonas lykanthroporepellens BL-DC-9]|nr:hypothetical protein Dehly_1482 [Dehalogenimonas lykanthroporepellens BL-DC-9]